jgi:hypothetical protein
MHVSFLKRNLLSSLLMVALSSCCAALVLSSCSKGTSAAIIGKWQVQGSKETVEFRKDGTVITYAPSGEVQVEDSGKYTFMDGSHMNLQTNGGDTNQPPTSISCEVHINGDKMDVTVTVPGGGQRHKSNLKRLK